MKIALSVLFLLLLPSCTHNAVALNQESQGWFWTEEMGVLYCKANPELGKQADPLCFIPTYVTPNKKWIDRK